MRLGRAACKGPEARHAWSTALAAACGGQVCPSPDSHEVQAGPSSTLVVSKAGQDDIGTHDRTVCNVRSSEHRSPYLWRDDMVVQRVKLQLQVLQAGACVREGDECGATRVERASRMQPRDVLALQAGKLPVCQHLLTCTAWQ
jgi:uncharacterized membrane protein